ncbi:MULTISPECIES: sensor histidine kinase [unclassified Kitasatospora]|uniref:sensor histidine kinase n=1 Tax=unclassified Kitasatospora TaxID=2633591 RepID=UPI0024752AC6|nr:ATP-binding protein [Kitasatospora sp. MAP12-44]
MALLGGAGLWQLACGRAGLRRARREARERLVTLRRETGERAAAEREAGRLEERERIGREVHDGLAQNLAATAMLLRSVTRDPTRAGEAGPAERLAVAYDTLLLGLDQAHDLTRGVAFAQLSGGGLVAAVGQYVTLVNRGLACLAELGPACGPAQPPQVRLRTSGAHWSLPLPTESAVLRVVGEALGNAVRHARAGVVTVDLDYRGDHLAAAVRDDGCGLPAGAGTWPAARPADSGGLGLAGAARLVRLAGGSLRVESVPGAGVAVLAEVPYPPLSPTAPD